MFWRRNESQEAEKQQDDRGSIPSKPRFSQITDDQGSIPSPQSWISLKNGDQGSISKEENFVAKVQSEDQD
jgi:hypothetical protein